MADRFRPTRAGIVNLWDYADHELAFHGGRLVLRGANGSGKTKALELLFPFLLDANISPQRLDPFSGAGRTMRDNLLYRPGRDTVIGYAWMEFRHGDGRCVVIGAGLRAQRAASGVGATWYFVTHRPVGDGWSLLDADRQPLALRGLRDTLGADDVYEQASAYRARVDRELFGGIGADRYAALIQLVLYLRRPQLAKDLDLRQLSQTLSAGLRPLDEDLVAEAARSFDDLEAVQHELERLEQACRAADRFARAYVPYVRVVARTRVDAVLDAQRDHAAATDEIATAETATKAAAAAIDAAQAAIDRAGSDETRFRDELEALRGSAAFQLLSQLDELRRHVGSLAREVDRSAKAARSAADALAVAVAELDEATRQTYVDRAAAERALERLRGSAVVVVPHRLAEVDTLVGVTEPGAVTTPMARERRLDLRAVRGALERYERAAAEAQRAEHELTVATEALDEASAWRDRAETAEAAARRAYGEALDVWAARWAWVTDDDRLTIATLVVDARVPEVRGAVLALSVVRRQDAAAALARLEDDATRASEQRAALVTERERVLAEQDDAPTPPATFRRDRTAVAGAPLWRVVDFAPTLRADERAGLEAALAAAGLLDAWVAPRDARDDAAHDVFLRGRSASAGAEHLGTLLVPDVPDDAGLTVADVMAALTAVPLTALHSHVGTDGRFVVGPLQGRSTKGNPEYVGATARAARRGRRAAELATGIAALDAALTEIGARREERRGEIAAYERALDDVPAPDELTAAVRKSDDAALLVVARQTEHAARQEALAVAAARRMAAGDGLRNEAAARDLPADAEGLRRVEDDLVAFEEAAHQFAAARQRVAASSARAAERALRRDERATAADDAGRTHVERAAAHQADAARLATFEDSLGSEPAEVLASITRVEADLLAASSALAAGRAAKEIALVQGERARNALTTAQERRRAAAAALDAARERIAPVRRPELRSVLDLDDTDSVDAFVGRVDDATRGTATGRERREGTKTAVRNAFKELETQLGPRYEAVLEDDDDIDLALVRDDEGRRGFAGFAARVTQRRDEQRLLLSASEREVLEQTLIDTLCRQLYQRLRDGEEQVDRMNRALRGRATTSGKGVQLTWTAADDLSDDQRQIVRLLERDPAVIGPDRGRLQEALAHEIRNARANEPAATYHQVLSRVLDYRAWRSFGVRLRERDGTERQLTRRLFNQHSGGERATILHLPLFAAAAAHFEAARNDCPRLIALDEAFAGIDATTTRQLLGLTVEFDLDVFLTGHDFWGTFREVPELAIVQLSHDRETHTVASLAMRWDGAVLHHER